ncbi:GIY-YIG nuclease family protein [Gillisia limnaea]|nr:GIY-YIG nuclease family protein [Gillisia limnaea]
MLSNKTRSMLYVGVTADLEKRISQHKNGEGSIYTKKYHLTHLMNFKQFTAIVQVIAREKQLKWNLIKSKNPELRDLFEDLR